jgi:hypothetical protein
MLCRPDKNLKIEYAEDALGIKNTIDGFDLKIASEIHKNLICKSY